MMWPACEQLQQGLGKRKRINFYPLPKSPDRGENKARSKNKQHSIHSTGRAWNEISFQVPKKNKKGFVGLSIQDQSELRGLSP